MKSHDELKNLLLLIDGKGYPAYKRIRDKYNFGKYILSVDHVQGDPFASPSKFHVILSHKTSNFPENMLDCKFKITAVCDFLTRTFENNINIFNKNKNGSGKSGTIAIDHCGQEMLERTSVIITKDAIEARFEIGLPAAGRRILGKSAVNIFFEIIPEIVENSLIYDNINKQALKKQVKLIMDQEYIRNELVKKNIVAFIANGSILPRENGISDKPLLKDSVPFKSPEIFQVEINFPDKRSIKGMGIPKGITLIVGGGYHGKSTLLKALELGVYNHIPGDGREFVITSQDAVKIRAEDGRSIEKVDISPFINNLPNNKDTVRFSTENASGSTSQAANVMEALEAGTKLLLIDEDTSATNFMIRDVRMQKLVAKSKEPITPFIDKIKSLYSQHGVSTILIIGGSGDYFDVADNIIMMDEYIPKDVTLAAKKIAATYGYNREKTNENIFGNITQRIILNSSFQGNKEHNKIKSKGKYCIMYGRSTIDLDAIEQLVDSSQTNCIGLMMNFLGNSILDNKISICYAVDRLFKQIETSGIDSISTYSAYPGNLALPRKYELCAAINRYRKLNIKS